MDFEEFYRTSASRLVGQLFVMTGDLHLAEDVVQEAFIRAAARWRSIGSYERPEAWVRRVAINLTRNHLRRVRRQLAAVVRHGPVRDEPELTHDHVAVREALAALPRRYREVLVLHYVADLPVQHIAEELGVPVGTVKARLSRGRRALAGQVSIADEEVSHRG